MATLASARGVSARIDKFYPVTAVIMALVLVAGFSLSIAMGRSSFGSALPVHLHGIVFFGWTVLYVTQNFLVAGGSVRLHRTLGWVSLLWIPMMVVLGLVVTALLVRRGHVPFFFTPLYFLLLDWLSILSFAGLATASIVMRKRTEWHRRLMFCAMAGLTGPGFGRLLPMPFLIPHAGIAVFATIMLFPVAGVLRDLATRGRVHPAWMWGIAVMTATQVIMSSLSVSAPGIALYDAVTAGSPGATVAPMAYPPFPPALMSHK